MIAASELHNVAEAHTFFWGGGPRPEKAAVGCYRAAEGGRATEPARRGLGHACDAPSAGPRLLRARAIAALMRRVPDSPRGRAECPPRGAVPLKGAEGKDGSARQTLLLAQRFLKTVEKL